MSSRLFPSLPPLFALVEVLPDGGRVLVHPALQEAEARVYMSWRPRAHLVAREIVCYLKTGGRRFSHEPAEGGVQ